MSQPYKLDKHMQALTIGADFDGVLILRPRYEITPDKAQRLYEGLMQWKKTAQSKAHFLIIPHDLDVFAFAKEKGYEDSGKKNP